MSSTLFPSQTVSPTYTVINAGGQIELRGDKADVVINGISLSETLQVIQDRLNILRPNTALEAEWDELRELGKHYRKIEAELKEKQRMWEIMKRVE